MAPEAILLAQDIITLCETDIQGTTQCLAPFAGLEDETRRSVFKRAQWTFAKSKITSRQASLDSLKLTLTLFLHTIELSGDNGDKYVSNSLADVEERGSIVDFEIQYHVARGSRTSLGEAYECRIGTL